MVEELFSDLTEREKNLLKAILKEYYKTGDAVSSLSLDRKGYFEVSSATIRNDLASLTEKGYLKKIHSFSGRLPTDKSFRFYVLSQLEEGNKNLQKIRERIEKKINDFISDFSRGDREKELVEFISNECQSYGFCYFFDKNEIIQKGFKYLIKEIPELKEERELKKLGELIDNLSEFLQEIQLENEIEIYIGEENPFLKIDSIAMMLAQAKDNVLGIIGPKKMPYERNIVFIKAIRNLIINEI